MRVKIDSRSSVCLFQTRTESARVTSYTVVMATKKTASRSKKPRKSISRDKKRAAQSLLVGNPAPAFSAPDQEGKLHALRRYRGQWILLYFYPKDDTPGCTKEACALRDEWEQFEKLNAVVLGVSIDSSASHLKFSQKYQLPFPLLADPQKKLVKLYGAWGKKTFMGRDYLGTRRSSFLIDPEGRIARIYSEVVPGAHALEVLSDIRTLSGKK